MKKGLLGGQGSFNNPPTFYDQKAEKERELGRPLTTREFEETYFGGGGTEMNETGTSVFDPVICELSYLWHTNEEDIVIDPFAGGSVRGIVATALGRQYIGVDLRQEQVDANIEQAKDICEGAMPVYVCGDSTDIETLAPGEYDFMFTCPPYGDLEKYSDDEKDISNMSPQDFDKAYTTILQRTLSMLKDNRFAVIVVGNYRDKKGNLRDLVGLTVRAMEEGGAHYYNDYVYVTPRGSLPIRIKKQFLSGRKNGKTHQYVLVFVKGDGKKATERLHDIEIPEENEV